LSATIRFWLVSKARYNLTHATASEQRIDPV